MIGTLLDTHTVQAHARRQSTGNPLPNMQRERLARRDPLPAGERRDVLVDMASVETGDHFALQQALEYGQAHHTAACRIEYTLHCHGTAVPMAVVARGPGKLGCVGESVRRRELDDACEIPGRHSLEYLDGGSLEREHDRAAWSERQIARRLRGHGGDQFHAAHVCPNMHAGAAMLDGEAGHPTLEHVARG